MEARVALLAGHHRCTSGSRVARESTGRWETNTPGLALALRPVAVLATDSISSLTNGPSSSTPAASSAAQVAQRMLEVMIELGPRRALVRAQEGLASMTTIKARAGKLQGENKAAGHTAKGSARHSRWGRQAMQSRQNTCHGMRHKWA